MELGNNSLKREDLFYTKYKKEAVNAV